MKLNGAETAVKCTQRHLGGVWKLARRRRRALRETWQLVSEVGSAAGESRTADEKQNHGRSRRERRTTAASGKKD